MFHNSSRKDEVTSNYCLANLWKAPIDGAAIFNSSLFLRQNPTLSYCCSLKRDSVRSRKWYYFTELSNNWFCKKNWKASMISHISLFTALLILSQVFSFRCSIFGVHQHTLLQWACTINTKWDFKYFFFYKCDDDDKRNHLVKSFFNPTDTSMVTNLPG